MREEKCKTTKREFTDVQEAVAARIEEIVKTRKEHLEMYCCAFIQKAGQDVMNWELVEEQHPGKTVWYFRRKESSPKTPESSLN